MKLYRLGSVTAALLVVASCSMPTVARMDDGSMTFRGTGTPGGSTFTSSTGVVCTGVTKGQKGVLTCSDGSKGTYVLDKDPSLNAFQLITGIGAISKMSGSGHGELNGKPFTFVWGPNV